MKQQITVFLMLATAVNISCMQEERLPEDILLDLTESVGNYPKNILYRFQTTQLCKVTDKLLRNEIDPFLQNEDGETALLILARLQTLWGDAYNCYETMSLDGPLEKQYVIDMNTMKRSIRCAKAMRHFIEAYIQLWNNKKQQS